MPARRSVLPREPAAQIDRCGVPDHRVEGGHRTRSEPVIPEFATPPDPARCASERLLPAHSPSPLSEESTVRHRSVTSCPPSRSQQAGVSSEPGAAHSALTFGSRRQRETSAVAVGLPRGRMPA